MALNGTMVKIGDTVTVGSGGQPAIEFLNIPQTYTDLKIVLSMRTNGAGASGNAWTPCIVTFNTTTTTSSRQLFGTGSATGSDTGVNNVYSADTDNTASTFSNSEIYIPNYTGTTQKSYSTESVTENNATGALALMAGGLTNLTSAITSVKVAPDTNSFAQYTTATLYGISRVPTGAKASGGMIAEDSLYWYHIFTNSGEFLPSQNLTIDSVIIAGGGGGSGNTTDGGGGGGAGGYRAFSGSVTSGTSYAITIGAGGAGGNSGTNGSNSVAFSTTSTGGGAGGTFNASGASGGSGGGGGRGAGGTSGGAASPVTSPVQGFAGGNGGGSCMSAGGGGGAGGVGQNNCSDCSGSPTGTCTRGGIGSNSHSSWWSAIANYMTGVSGWRDATSTGYIAGGGAGMFGGGALAVPGGAGGGGSLLGGNVSTPGIANTGSGGTAGKFTFNATAGGRGLVVVRYAKV